MLMIMATFPSCKNTGRKKARCHFLLYGLLNSHLEKLTQLDSSPLFRPISSMPIRAKTDFLEWIYSAHTLLSSLLLMEATGKL